MPYPYTNCPDRREVHTCNEDWAMTTTKKNARGEDVIRPFVTRGDLIRTNLGNATVCSLVWYKGNGKMNTLLDCCSEQWAQKEGFTGLYEADKHFSEKFGKDWLEQEMMSVKFRIEGVNYD